MCTFTWLVRSSKQKTKCHCTTMQDMQEEEKGNPMQPGHRHVERKEVRKVGKLHAAKSYLLHKLTRLLHKASRFNSPLPSKKEKCQ